MNLWKPIVKFVTHKKVLSSLIGVAMIGSVSAAGVAVNNSLSSPTDNGDTSSVVNYYAITAMNGSSTPSPVNSESRTSSAVQSGSSGVNSSSYTSTSSQVTSSSATLPDSSSIISSGGSSTDNSAARQAAIDAENTRHSNALSDIDNQYDPQISALQKEIAAFQAEGAQDETSSIAALQKQSDDAWAYFNKTSAVYGSNSDEAQRALNHYNECMTILKKYQSLNSDYQTMLQSQSQLDSLQTRKSLSISSENSIHAQYISNISLSYS